LERLTGRFNDGRTARSRPVSVTLGPSGLEITEHDGPLIAVWPVQEIHLTERVSGLGEVRLRCGYQDPARLVLSDPDALAFLGAACPNLHKLEPSGWRYWQPAVYWGGGAVLSIVLLITLVIPSLASAIARNMPEAWEARIGREVRQQVIAGLAALEGRSNDDIVCSGKPGVAALEVLVSSLLKGAADAPNVTVSVLDLRTVNAFALPGGHVLILRGLIDKAAAPNALAGVVAHELGHVIEGHPLEVAIERSATAVIVGLLLGDVAGGTIVAGAGEVLLGTAYSREAEREADAIGLELMGEAGFDARPLGPFLTALTADQDESDLLALLSSHPLTVERTRQIERDARPGGPAMSDEAWKAVRAICG